jgi:hypothetical protein
MTARAEFLAGRPVSVESFAGRPGRFAGRPSESNTFIVASRAGELDYRVVSVAWVGQLNRAAPPVLASCSDGIYLAHTPAGVGGDYVEMDIQNRRRDGVQRALPGFPGVRSAPNLRAHWAACPCRGGASGSASRVCLAGWLLPTSGQPLRLDQWPVGASALCTGGVVVRTMGTHASRLLLGSRPLGSPINFEAQTRMH